MVFCFASYKYRESDFTAAGFFYSRVSQPQDYSIVFLKVIICVGGSSSYYRIFSMLSGELHYVSIPLPQLKQPESFLTPPVVKTDREKAKSLQ